MTTKTERINLHDEIASICDKLGLEATNVARIVLHPTSATVDVFEVNIGGRKYLNGNNQPAMETLTFEVST